MRQVSSRSRYGNVSSVLCLYGASVSCTCALVSAYIDITKYGSTLYIGMDEVSQHHGHTFEKSNLNFQFQFEFSSYGQHCVSKIW